MEAIKDAVEKLGGKAIIIDATSLAQQAGNVRTMNVVMLGALVGTGKVPVSVETLKQVVRENVPPKTIDANLSAFDLGVRAVQK